MGTLLQLLASDATLDIGQAVLMMIYGMLVLFKPKNFFWQGLVLGLLTSAKFWGDVPFFVLMFNGYNLYKKRFEIKTLCLQMFFGFLFFSLTYIVTFVHLHGNFNMIFFQLKVLKYWFAHSTAATPFASVILFKYNLTINTRNITVEDHPKLISFWKENYFVNEMDSLDRFKLFLEKNPGLSFVTEENGKIVGTVLGSFDGRRGYIQKLVVDKNLRGKGLGKKLIDLAMGKLLDLGALYIPISCDSKNLPFYEKNGFKKTDQVTVGYSK